MIGTSGGRLCRRAVVICARRPEQSLSPARSGRPLVAIGVPNRQVRGVRGVRADPADSDERDNAHPYTTHEPHELDDL